MSLLPVSIGVGLEPASLEACMEPGSTGMGLKPNSIEDNLALGWIWSLGPQRLPWSGNKLESGSVGASAFLNIN